MSTILWSPKFNGTLEMSSKCELPVLIRPVKSGDAFFHWRRQTNRDWQFSFLEGMMPRTRKPKMQVKPPAFQFYAQDFLVGTSYLTCEELGAFIRLLCYAWVNEGVPDNDAGLCLLAQCRPEVLIAVRKKFVAGQDGMLRNKRMERVRLNKQSTVRSKRPRSTAVGGTNECRKVVIPRYNHGTTMVLLR